MTDGSDREPGEGALGPRETPMPRDQHGDRAGGVASAGTVGPRTGTGGVGPGVAPDPATGDDLKADVPPDVGEALDRIGDDQQASPGGVGAKTDA
jgi:hypothetical protein